MKDILFMMVYPFVAACLLLLVRNDRARSAITTVSAAVIIATSVLVTYNYFGKPEVFTLNYELIDLLMFLAEVILGIVIILLGVKHKKYWASALDGVQILWQRVFF